MSTQVPNQPYNNRQVVPNYFPPVQAQAQAQAPYNNQNYQYYYGNKTYYPATGSYTPGMPAYPYQGTLNTTYVNSQQPQQNQGIGAGGAFVGGIVVGAVLNDIFD